jgi:hypothetical protein
VRKNEAARFIWIFTNEILRDKPAIRTADNVNLIYIFRFENMSYTVAQSGHRQRQRVRWRDDAILILKSRDERKS